MKSSRKFYGMHVSMTKKSGDFQKLIITTTITHNTTNVDTLICHSYVNILHFGFNRHGYLIRQYLF